MLTLRIIMDKPRKKFIMAMSQPILGLILSPPALHCQTFHGTAVDVLSTNTDAIVAMDTLLLLTMHRTHFPNVCKLTQHGNALVALSGQESAEQIFLPNIVNYDSQFDHILNQQQLTEAVRSWSEYVASLFFAELGQLGWDRMQAMSDGGQLTEAEFFATDSNGKLVTVEVIFLLVINPATNAPDIRVGTRTMGLDKPFHSFAKGNDVEEELRENVTPRSKKNQKVLKDLESQSLYRSREFNAGMEEDRDRDRPKAKIPALRQRPSHSWHGGPLGTVEES